MAGNSTGTLGIEFSDSTSVFAVAEVERNNTFASFEIKTSLPESNEKFQITETIFTVGGRDSEGGQEISASLGTDSKKYKDQILIKGENTYIDFNYRRYLD